MVLNSAVYINYGFIHLFYFYYHHVYARRERIYSNPIKHLLECFRLWFRISIGLHHPSSSKTSKWPTLFCLGHLLEVPLFRLLWLWILVENYCPYKDSKNSFTQSRVQISLWLRIWTRLKEFDRCCWDTHTVYTKLNGGMCPIIIFKRISVTEKKNIYIYRVYSPCY